MIHATLGLCEKCSLLIKIGPTYELGNCVKDNKTDWGWSPWSSGL